MRLTRQRATRRPRLHYQPLSIMSAYLIPRRLLTLGLALLLIPLLAACDSNDDAEVPTARAILTAPADTTTGVTGTVDFTELDGGVRITAVLAGLTPGQHGFHLHTNESCARGDHDGDGFAEVGGAAGPHYDPLGTNDHGAPDDPLDEKHLGDFGNVTADENGDATRTLIIEDLDLNDVLDRAVIVHSDRDDLETDPGGNSGDRVGCGIVRLVGVAL